MDTGYLYAHNMPLLLRHGPASVDTGGGTDETTWRADLLLYHR